MVMVPINGMEKEAEMFKVKLPAVPGWPYPPPSPPKIWGLMLRVTMLIGILIGILILCYF